MMLEPAPPVGSTDALRGRADQLWRARAEEDWHTTYLFENPRRRDTATVEEYSAWKQGNEPFRVESYQIADVLVEDLHGWVELEVVASARRFPGAPSRRTTRWEKWFLFEDQWLPIPDQLQTDYPDSPALRDAEQEERVLARCQEFWNARRDEDWSRMLELVEPDDREQFTMDELEESQSILKYLSHEVRWVEVIGDKGRTRVRFEHRFNDPSMTKARPIVIENNERWIKVGDEWYVDLLAGTNAGAAQ
ncbi:MAG: hypothetical protein ACYTGC_12635 [Planctomycetota bacterium]